MMSKVEITGMDPRSERFIRVRVEGGTVSSIEDAERDHDLYLSAGLVDLQVNGCAGFDLNAAQISTETVIGLTEAMLERGVTSFVPTLITAPEESICRSLRVIAEARRMDKRCGLCIPFVHVEGPHISEMEGYRGAHAQGAVRTPSVAEFDRWQKAGEGIVGMVTLSPHFDESEAYIAALAGKGIRIAIGHTHASAEQIRRAVNAGASVSTHLGNGIAQKIERHSNPLWSQLAEDRLTATVIADGHHLPPEVLQVILRAKGAERLVLVSDSVALAGMPAGVYDTPVGGRVQLTPQGKLCVFGSELLAGSTATLAQCVGRMAKMTGLAFCDALAMATVNPGRLAGGRGQLAVGTRADLVRFHVEDELVVDEVWLAGECVDLSRSIQ